MIKVASRPAALKRRQVWGNLALLVGSTLFALLLCELALRLLGFSPLYVSPERDRFWEYDPRLGWAHEPGQTGVFETPQFRTNIRINSRGLRDREHSYEGQPGVPRILVLGDSFAWGYGVEETERFSQVLEQALGVEVINAGVSGYSTDQELLWLEDEGVKYDFDLLILAFTGNDLGDNGRQLVSTIYGKPRFEWAGGQLNLVGTPVARTGLAGRSVYFLSQRSALVYFGAQQYFDLRTVLSRLRGGKASIADASLGNPAGTGPYDLTLALLDEMQSIAAAHNAAFMIVANDRWWNGQPDESYSDFIHAVEAHGFLTLDVEAQPGFDAGAMLIPNDGHWNAAGHAFVGAELQTFIARHALLGQPENEPAQPPAP